MKMPKELGKLEEAAIKRKERLLNLKRKFDGKPTEPEETDKEKSSEIPKPTFRNYTKDGEEKSVADVELPDVEMLVKDQLEEMKEPLEVKDIDLTSLAPRKVDFDLKRAINKKLLKLEKKTQKAISELIRERLQNESQKEDLLEQVNVGAKLQSQQLDDDDSD